MLDDTALAALFASDLARDVRNEYESQRCYGVSVPDATTAAIAQFHHALSHQTDGPVVILTLAVLQLRDGWLHPTMRNAALELLESDETFMPLPGEPTQLRIQRSQLRDKLLAVFRDAPVVDDDVIE